MNFQLIRAWRQFDKTKHALRVRIPFDFLLRQVQRRLLYWVPREVLSGI